MCSNDSCDYVVLIGFFVVLIMLKYFTNTQKEVNMEQTNKKQSILLKVKECFIETLWSIGTQVTATVVAFE